MNSSIEDELLLMLIACKATIGTLVKLVDAGLWNTIKLFVHKEHFWYLRVQHNLNTILHWQPGEWKQVHWDFKLNRSKHMSHYDTTRVLLETGYDPDRRKIGDLVVASREGNARVLQLLIKRGWSNLDPETAASALVSSCYNPNHEVTKLLLSAYRSKLASHMNEAASLAAQNGYAETLMLFLEDREVDPSTWHTTDFMLACRREASTVSLLVDDGRLSIDTLNHGLISACATGRAEIVKVLLSCKNVDPITQNHEPIIQASTIGSEETIRELLNDRRVNPGARENVAIRYAVESGREGAVRVLLTDKRVNPSVKKSIAFTRACSLGHLRIAQLLLEPRSSSPRVVNPAAGENTPLRSAVAAGRVDVVNWLLTLPNVDPMSGSANALEEAQHRGKIHILDTLIRDRRVNLDVALSRHYDWIGSLRTHMEDRLVGCLVANATYNGPLLTIDNLLLLIIRPSSTVFLLLQFVLMKRPTGQEIMDWLIGRRSVDAALAARSVQDDYPRSIKHRNNEFTAYRALLLLLASEEKGSVILDRLKTEDGVTEEGILLAAMILGAHLGSRPVIDWR